MSGDEQSGNPDNAATDSPALSQTPPQGVRSQRKDTLLGVGVAPQKKPEPEGEEPPLLPGTKTEYSAPRALPAAQRDADLGPEATIEVAATARVSSVVREDDEPTATSEDRAASARLDTLPPKARVPVTRGRMIALGVLGAGCVVLLGAAFMRFSSGTGHVVSGSPAAAAAATDRAPVAAATTSAEPEPGALPAETAEPAPTVAPVAHALDDLPTAPEGEAEGEEATTAAPVAAHVAPPKHTPSSAKNDTAAAAKAASKPAAPRTSPPKTAAGGSIVRESPF